MEMESAGGGGGWRRGSFYPIVVGVTSESSAADSSSDVAPRVVLVNPVTQSMALLHGDAALAVAEILADRRRRSADPQPPPPASRASIDAMKTLQLVTTATEIGELVEEEEEEEEDCAVCLESMRLIVKEMPCKHRFHGDCIDKWLMIHGSCPVCRFQMPPEESPSGGCGGEQQQQL